MHAVFSKILLLLGKVDHCWSPGFLCAYLGRQKPPDRNFANFLCPLPATWTLICPLVSLPASCLRGWGQMPSSQSQFYLQPPALSSRVLPSAASVTVSCLVPFIRDVSIRQHSGCFFDRHPFPLPSQLLYNGSGLSVFTPLSHQFSETALSTMSPLGKGILISEQSLYQRATSLAFSFYIWKGFWEVALSWPQSTVFQPQPVK